MSGEIFATEVAAGVVSLYKFPLEMKIDGEWVDLPAEVSVRRESFKSGFLEALKALRVDSIEITPEQIERLRAEGVREVKQIFVFARYGMLT